MSNKQKGDRYEEEIKIIAKSTDIAFCYGKKKINFADSTEGSNIIKGYSGAKHQIDIHLVKDDYHLLIECKNYKRDTPKSVIASYITVINDIKKKYKDWKIIPVLSSNSAFQRGAKQLAICYRLSNIRITDDFKHIEFHAGLTFRRPIYSDIVVYYADGSFESINQSNKHTLFRNYELGDDYEPERMIKHFKDILDEKGNPINMLENYVGMMVCKNVDEGVFFKRNEPSKIVSEIKCARKGEIVDGSEELLNYKRERLGIFYLNDSKFEAYSDGRLNKIK